MQFIISTTASSDQLFEVLRTIDPNVSVDVSPPTEAQVHVQQLITAMRTESVFEGGLISPEMIDDLIAAGGELELRVINQVRYNGANLEVVGDAADVLDSYDVDHIYDAYSDHIYGDLLKEVSEVLLISMIGINPDQRVIDALKSGQIRLLNISSIEAQQDIFNDYQAFVNVLLTERTHSDVFVDITEGFDS